MGEEKKGERNMEIKEAVRLKVELEKEILESIERFTAKTSIYVCEINLYGQLRHRKDGKGLNMHVDIKTSL